MIFCAIKANLKQKEIKELVAVSYNFLKEVTSKLDKQCRKGSFFT